MDFANLLGPSLQKPCPRCGGAKVIPTAPHIACEPCDGSGWVPNEAGRGLLDLLGARPIPIGVPPAPAGR